MCNINKTYRSELFWKKWDGWGGDGSPTDFSLPTV